VDWEKLPRHPFLRFMCMGTTKVLVVANTPRILQRLEDTLAGLKIQSDPAV